MYLKRDECFKELQRWNASHQNGNRSRTSCSCSQKNAAWSSTVYSYDKLKQFYPAGKQSLTGNRRKRQKIKRTPSGKIVWEGSLKYPNVVFWKVGTVLKDETGQVEEMSVGLRWKAKWRWWYWEFRGERYKSLFWLLCDPGPVQKKSVFYSLFQISNIGQFFQLWQKLINECITIWQEAILQFLNENFTK